jgi:hypothetical protein
VGKICGGMRHVITNYTSILLGIWFLTSDCMCFQANEKAAPYKNKVIHNWNEICTIYSKDHATGLGARTGAE